MTRNKRISTDYYSVQRPLNIYGVVFKLVTSQPGNFALQLRRRLLF